MVLQEKLDMKISNRKEAKANGTKGTRQIVTYLVKPRNKNRETLKNKQD